MWNQVSKDWKANASVSHSIFSHLTRIKKTSVYPLIRDFGIGNYTVISDLSQINVLPNNIYFYFEISQ